MRPEASLSLCNAWTGQGAGRELKQLKDLEMAKAQLNLDRQTLPLRLAMLPGFVTDVFDSFNPLVAGLLLVLSVGRRGWMPSLVLLPASAVILLGARLGVPAVGPLSANLVSMAVGAVLGVVGLSLLGRR